MGHTFSFDGACSGELTSTHFAGGIKRQSGFCLQISIFVIELHTEVAGVVTPPPPPPPTNTAPPLVAPPTAAACAFDMHLKFLYAQPNRSHKYLFVNRGHSRS